MIEEAKELFRRGFTGDPMNGLYVLRELRWLLTRSSGWNQALLDLGFEIKHVRMLPSEEVRLSFEGFYRNGVFQAEKHVSKLRRHGGPVADAMSAQAVPSLVWQRVRDAIARLRQLVSGMSPTSEISLWREGCEVAMMGIHCGAQEFISGFNDYVTRPRSALEALRGQLSLEDKTARTFEYSVPRACPAIAIAPHDFRSLCELFLENERKSQRNEVLPLIELQYDSGQPDTVVVHLRGGKAWTVEGKVLGGLATMREICARVGGKAKIPVPRKGVSGTTGDHVELLLPAWRRGN